MIDFKDIQFGRSGRKSAKRMRLRVESCIDTVLELNERLGEGKIKPEIIHQFEKLRDSLKTANDETVDEQDINRIEDATNQLLLQIKKIYGKDLVGGLYEGPKH
jgi:hypothetical protein